MFFAPCFEKQKGGIAHAQEMVRTPPSVQKGLSASVCGSRGRSGGRRSERLFRGRQRERPSDGLEPLAGPGQGQRRMAADLLQPLCRATPRVGHHLCLRRRRRDRRRHHRLAGYRGERRRLHVHQRRAEQPDRRRGHGQVRRHLRRRDQGHQQRGAARVADGGRLHLRRALHHQHPC